jgi:tRNA 2-selenouridine synthase SelU
LPDGTTVASEITAIKNKLVDLVTKEDIKGLVKKEDLKNFLTKDDISGLATKKDVTDAEGRLEARINELMTKDGKNRLDAVDIALEELATDLGTTKDEITKQLTKFESDLALDIAKLATKQDVLDSEKRIRDKQDEYVRQGMKADEALQAAIDAVAEEQEN